MTIYLEPVAMPGDAEPIRTKDTGRKLAMVGQLGLYFQDNFIVVHSSVAGKSSGSRLWCWCSCGSRCRTWRLCSCRRWLGGSCWRDCKRRQAFIAHQWCSGCIANCRLGERGIGRVTH
jgi:hypothetical protein